MPEVMYGLRYSTSAAETGSPSAYISCNTRIMSTVFCRITDDATKSMKRTRFCCSLGSFSLITSPPKSSHFVNAWYDSILFVVALTSWRISLLEIQRNK